MAETTKGTRGIFLDKGGAVHNAKHGAYGAKGDGTTGDAAAAALVLAKSGRILFPVGTYLHNSSVEVDMEDYAEAILHGATLKTASDIVLWDLHTSADPLAPTADTRFMQTVEGGLFRCTATTPLAATALKLHAFRNIRVSRARFWGWKYAIQLAGQDTYIVSDCHFNANDIGVYIPDWSSATGGETIIVKLRDSHFSCGSGTTAAVKVEGEVSAFKVQGGSFNGPGAVIHFASTAAGAGDALKNISIRDAHFEQQATNCIWLQDVSGLRTLGFQVQGCDFAPNGATAIKLERATGIRISECQFSQTAAASGWAVDIGINCRDIVIDMDTCWFLDKTRIKYACSRREITFAPEVRETNIPRSVTGYHGNTLNGTGNATIDMSAALSSEYPEEAPPKGYWVQMQAKDSGSASAACHVGVAKQALSSTDRLRLDLHGVPSGSVRTIAGYVKADDNGDILIDYNTTGLDTMTVYLTVTAIHM